MKSGGKLIEIEKRGGDQRKRAKQGQAFFSLSGYPRTETAKRDTYLSVITENALLVREGIGTQRERERETRTTEKEMRGIYYEGSRGDLEFQILYESARE